MRGGGDDEAAREDLRVAGATEEQIVFAMGPVPEAFEVWPEAWPAVQAFLKVQTQWAAGASGATGLDYTRARDGLELAGITVTPDLWAQLQVIEFGVLDTLNETKPKGKGRGK